MTRFISRNYAASRIQSRFRGNRSRYKMRNKRSAAPVRRVQRIVRNMDPYKYVVSSLAQAIPLAWTVMYNASNVQWAEAITPDSRTSTKIQLKGLSLSGHIAPSTTDATNIIRLALIRGRRAGALNAANIAFDPNTSGDDIHLQFNQRFVDVLWSKKFNLQNTTAGAVFSPYKEYDKYFKMSTICKYQEAPTGAATFSVQPYNNSAIYLVACSNSSAISLPRLTGQCRLSFKDLD